MAVGGALAGIGGLTQLAGAEFKLRPGFVAGYGYIGFLASWLGRHRPVYVVLSAALLSAIVVGGDSLQIDSALPAASVNVLMALLLLMVFGFGKQEGGDPMSLISEVLTGGIRGGTSINYAALGESVSERGGVINLGTEGSMLCGALGRLRHRRRDRATCGSAWPPAPSPAGCSRSCTPTSCSPAAPTSWPPVSSCCSSGSG